MDRLYPKRIVSLAAEGPEILELLGAFDRLVGVSGFARRPEKVRSLPKVGGFATPNLEKVMALDPDLIITISDVQADAAAHFIRQGLPVLALNPHFLDDVWRNILLVGGMIGKEREAQNAVSRLQEELASIAAAHPLSRPVRVFFEEWPDPLISGIGWVSDLIHYLGGEDIFRDLHDRRIATERIITREEVARRAPDVIIASWCGKEAKLEEIRSRPEWQDVPAVRNGHIYEIPSHLILQTGPGLLEGAKALARILTDVADSIEGESRGATGTFSLGE